LSFGTDGGGVVGDASSRSAAVVSLSILPQNLDCPNDLVHVRGDTNLSHEAVAELRRFGGAGEGSLQLS